MIEMRQQGMTYAEIGQTMGVSKQRVFNLIGGTSESKHRLITEKDCVYVGIRNWMNENKISRTMMTRLVYGTYHPEKYARFRNVLKGVDCHKHNIDKILKVTGLTYEEAFKLEEAEE